MNWIISHTVENHPAYTKLSGAFSASGGNFSIRHVGDGGNADTTEITISGPQYEKDLKLTITGAWEIREVIDMFKLLEKII